MCTKPIHTTAPKVTQDVVYIIICARVSHNEKERQPDGKRYLNGIKSVVGQTDLAIGLQS